MAHDPSRPGPPRPSPPAATIPRGWDPQEPPGSGFANAAAAQHGLKQLLAAHTQTRLSPLLPWELKRIPASPPVRLPATATQEQTPPKLREQKTLSPPTTSTSRMTQGETPMNNQAVCLASCASLMQWAGNLLQGSQAPTASEPKPQGSARLTWTKASNRGPLSHLRRANDLAQWATSPDVRPGTWGSRSAAKRWNTCVCWKPSLPSGQREPRVHPRGSTDCPGSHPAIPASP